MVLNKKVTKEEYDHIRDEMFLNKEAFSTIQKKFEALKLATPRRFSNQIKCHNSTGDDLTGCKNTLYAFNCRNVEDSKYMFDLGDDKDSMDVYEHGWIVPSERIYESHAGMESYNLRFTHMCSNGKDQTYTDVCVNDCSDLFGCISMKKSQYCILNKQYTKEAYETLSQQIIEHMKKTGEWGEFFPIACSPFGYNETPAQEQHPMAREEVVARGWKWQDHLPSTKGKETIDMAEVPFCSAHVDSAAYASQIFACETCTRNYKLLKQELEFYKKYTLPIPRICSDCRRAARFAMRNKRVLHHRQCMCERDGHDHMGCCTIEFETTYFPERPEIVYCEQCYQKEMI